MNDSIHEIIRAKQQWGSCGKFHKDPLIFRLVKDLSDSHLLHIIAWIKIYMQTDEAILKIMENEQLYRTKHYIFIECYEVNNLIQLN